MMKLCLGTEFYKQSKNYTHWVILLFVFSLNLFHLIGFWISPKGLEISSLNFPSSLKMIRIMTSNFISFNNIAILPLVVGVCFSYEYKNNTWKRLFTSTLTKSTIYFTKITYVTLYYFIYLVLYYLFMLISVSLIAWLNEDNSLFYFKIDLDLVNFMTKLCLKNILYYLGAFSFFFIFYARYGNMFWAFCLNFIVTITLSILGKDSTYLPSIHIWGLRAFKEDLMFVFQNYEVTLDSNIILFNLMYFVIFTLAGYILFKNKQA